MLKRIAIGTLAVVVGSIAGMVVMTGLHMASGLVYPPPPGVDLASSTPAAQVAMKAWLATLPAGAFLLASVAHGLGCMAGAALATVIDRRRSLVPAIVVGALFTVAGILNLAEIPHPAWFPYVDLPLYLLLAFAAGKRLTLQAAAIQESAHS